MSEFDNNNVNQDDSKNNNGNNVGNNNQSPNNRAPEYSFWAEQMPSSSNSNSNPGANTWGSGNNPNVGSGYNPNIGGSYNPNAGNGYNTNTGSGYNPNAGNGYNTNAGNSYNPNPGNVFNTNMYNQSNETPSKPKKERKASKFIAKALCFGIIAGISFIGFQKIYYTIDPDAVKFQLAGGNTSDQGYEIGYTQTGDVKVESKSAISEIVNSTMPSIVSINSTSTQTTDWFGQQFDQEVEGSGSGFIVGKNEEELLIATNNHVVSGTNKITVTFIDGSEAEAIIKGTDATADLAVITVDITAMKQETLDTIKIAKLGNSDEIKVGEMAIAIGNALGYGQSVTVGYISAKDREVEITDGYDTKTMVLLQTDAAINPGNSGGALLNLDGEVIGINSVKYASNEVEGMGYSIPISRATPIINELMNREVLEEDEQGYLGIAGNDVTEDVADYYNMPVGVFVNEVTAGGAAEKGGLLAGDVITKVDDIEITAITQLRDYVTSLRVGTEVEVTYMRNADGDYKEGKVTVSLGKNPNLNTSEQ